ncbi:MAG: hypothetical protein M3Y27_07985, partial [Acidobacteriota bacterium]|nr:hypothetical protein [Acidobacteriota bacterium]
MIVRSWIANLSCALLILVARIVSAQAPQNGSVSPQSSGGPAGVSQSFTFTFTDTAAGGAANIDWIALDVGPTLAAGGSCYMYIPRNPPVLNLMNSNPNSLQWIVPQITPGSGQTAHTDSQSGNLNCMISGAGFTVTTSGNTLTVTVPITFFSPYLGTQNIYMIAHDVFGQYSGWTTAGTWTVGTMPPPPNNPTVSPSGGTSLSQTFTFSFSDTAGGQHVTWMEGDFGSAPQSAASCFFIVGTAYPYQLTLEDDSGNWLLNQAIDASHPQGTTSNSRCMISANGLSAAAVGNTVSINVPVTFSSNYSGTKNIYSLAGDDFGQQAGWFGPGTWTVGSASGTVTATAVNPSNGSGPSGSPQQFTVHYSDTVGFSDISYGAIAFLPSNQSGCLIEWYASSRALNLIGSGGSHIDGTFGQVPPNPLSNAYCSIDTVNSQLASSQ